MNHLNFSKTILAQTTNTKISHNLKSLEKKPLLKIQIMANYNFAINTYILLRNYHKEIG